MVVERRYGAPGRLRLERLLGEAEIETIAVTREQAVIACEAFRRFGRGRHPASLNFGDLFAYALARASGESLLFKGDDFARTDVEGA
jgi:ribonuclease VapC